MKRLFFKVSLAASCFVLSCAGPKREALVTPDAGGGDGGDAGPVDAGPTTCPDFAPYEAGDDGHPNPLGASSTEARAGRLTAADLPTDPTGLGTYAAGDFVLANDKIAIIVEDVGASDLYLPWGGGIVGLAKVRDGHLVEAADFNESFVAFGRFVLHATHVSVLASGADGGTAIVRASGTLGAIPFIDDFGRTLAPGDFSDLDAAIDYKLAPGAEVADIEVTLGVPRVGGLILRQVMHAFFQEYRMPLFAPGGDGFAAAGGPYPWIGFASDSTSGFAWIPGEGQLTRFLDLVGFSAYTAPNWSLPGCMRTTKLFARVVVGGPGIDGVRAAVARATGDAQRVVTGTVTDGAGSPAAHVHVHATLADGTYVTRATTDGTGHYALSVPASADIELTPLIAAEGMATPTSVPATTSSADLHLPPVGSVHVVATEAVTHAALPVRVQLLADGPPTIVPPAWGEVPPAHERQKIVFAVDGDAVVNAPPGHYQVVVSHGYEYELANRSVDVTAGATTEVTVELEHSVDTTGIQCADFHVHTYRSPDSEDTGLFKVSSAAADGLEIPVRSDHEWINGFDHEIATLGVAPWVFGITSEELTTFVWGHFGVFPLVSDSSPNGGAVQWVGSHPSAVFAGTRARPEAPAIIINHPRTFGLGSVGAFFVNAGFDPASGTVSHPEFWDDTFTIVEVFTGSDYAANKTASVADWYGLISHGRRIFAVGSSDSHHVANGSPVGYPRTCIRLGTDDPRMLTPNGVRDAVLSGAMTVSGGIYVDAQVGATLVGGEARGVGARARAHVTVQAASWVDVRRLIVVVDGHEAQTIAIDGSMADPAHPAIRFAGDIDVDVADGASGSFVVFAAEGDDDLSPVHPGYTPFGVTNPIFLFR